MFAKAAVATGAGVAESPPKSAANIRRLSRTIGLSITILLSAFTVEYDRGCGSTIVNEKCEMEQPHHGDTEHPEVAQRRMGLL